MKIGILTFHCAINYGAVLQAYGLQEYLKSLGHEVYIIDYRPDYLITPYRLFFSEAAKGRGLLGNIRFFVRELLAVPIRYKRRKAFQRFIKTYLHLAKMDFQSENNDYDCFVFGSDQVWNPQITGGDSVFFGDAPCFKGKRMITYAASAGNASTLKEIDAACLKGWLSNFSAISVREKSLSHYLTEELQLNNQLVLDPVLLAGKDIFHKIASSKINEKPYLLFFSLQKNDEALQLARRFAKKERLELIEMYSAEEVVKNKKVLQCLSPEEFVGMFKGAKYVVSTSFHGTVFSILFYKPFICSCYNCGNSRFHSLLDMLGLQERLMEVSPIKELNLTDINWSLVDEIIFQNRKKSSSFIENALNRSI